MNKPDLRLFLGCPAEVRRYIAFLENQSQVRESLLLHEVSGNQHLTNVIKSMTDIQRFRYTTDKDRAELIADEQREQLDQFAMAALPVAHEQVQELPEATLKRIIGKGDSLLPITGEHVRQAVAITAYMMAEAMQAESQKRSGGAA